MPEASTEVSEEITQTWLYRNPLVASTYDPDGFFTLMEQYQDGGGIDWEDDSIWDNWYWVALEDPDGNTAGPGWWEMSGDEKTLWYENNVDFIENQLGESIHDLDFRHPLGIFDPYHADVGNLYNTLRGQGAVGGTEIDYNYYINQPLWTLAWSTINWDYVDGLDDPFALGVMDGSHGLTDDHLKYGMQHIVETFVAVGNDRLRPAWDAPLPEVIKPVEMDVDYKTPFTMPKPIPKLASPKMSQNLQDLKVRSGSQMEQTYEDVHSNLNPTT